jgi:hypothetical protein
MFYGGAPQPYWTNLTDPTTLRACSARIIVFDLCADTPAACYGENQGRDNTALDQASKSTNEMPYCCGQLGFFAPHAHGTSDRESPVPRRGSNP